MGAWFEPGFFYGFCSVVDRKIKRALRSLHLIWSLRSIDVLTAFPLPSGANIFCFTTRACSGLALVLVVRYTPKSYHVRCCFSLNSAQSHAPVLVANLNPNNWLLFNQEQEQEQPSKLWQYQFLLLLAYDQRLVCFLVLLSFVPFASRLVFRDSFPAITVDG